MNPYHRYLLPYLLDGVCSVKAIRRQRAKVVPAAAGRVLEIGIGTGLNLAYYDRLRVSSLSGLEPAPQMHRLAQRRARRAGIELTVLTAEAEAIPAPDASFDTLVTTFTLCTIPHPEQALREMRRVLAPGGRLLFCEHGEAADAGVLKWQRRLNPVWRPLAGGCHLDRPIPALLRGAGFKLTELQTLYLPGPRPLTYNYWGVAEAAR
ncbi:MAG: class I SAM-dependent methyltransferase [Gammaproteobacteria bacterium]|nr:class I SAM-dependent methyltransferase [Gammaproteobacteria bacterium]